MTATRRSRSMQLRRWGFLTVIALAAGGLPSERTASAAPGPLAVDPPQHPYAVGDPGPTLTSGATNYLVAGDFDDDGFPDVVNVTSAGFQVFRNEGTVGGQLQLAFQQEFEIGYSAGGGAIDFDGDDDLDLVLGDVKDLVVAVNDGTGSFHVTRPRAHNFIQPTVAVPFHTRGGPAFPGNSVRVAIGASAESVGSDSLGVNPLNRPFLYVLEYDGASWVTLQQLDDFNVEGVVAGDLNGDGAADLVAPDRSGNSGTPFYAYLEDRSDGLYDPFTGFDQSGFGFDFGFGPAIAPDGDLAVGTWHKVAVYDRAAAPWVPIARTSSIETGDTAFLVDPAAYRDGDFDTETALTTSPPFGGTTNAATQEDYEDVDVLSTEFRLRAKVGGEAGGGYFEMTVRVFDWVANVYDVIVFAHPGDPGPHEVTFPLGPEHVSPGGDVRVAGIFHTTGDFPGAVHADYFESVLEFHDFDPPAYPAPVFVSLDPAGQGYPTGEAFASQFADMNGDGLLDLVTLGRSTPLELVRLDGDPNDLANRFHAAPVTGQQMEAIALDWDQDLFGVPDVMTGGTEGLWFYRNVNGGSAGTPGAPPTPSAGEELTLAYDGIVDLLDPDSADPLNGTHPTFTTYDPPGPETEAFFDQSRNDLGDAFEELTPIDPLFFTGDFVYGDTNGEKVETLRGYWQQIDFARDSVADARSETSDPDDIARLDEIDLHLANAQAQIVIQAGALGGVVPKSAAARRSQRLLRTGMRNRNLMQSEIAGAHIATDPAVRQEHFDLASRTGRKALDKLLRYWRGVERRRPRS